MGFREVKPEGPKLSLEMARGVDLVLRASVDYLPSPPSKFGLVDCAEVLEDPEEPVRAVRAAKRVSGRHVLMGAPNEPIRQVMNVLRGALGGTWGIRPRIVHTCGLEGP